MIQRTTRSKIPKMIAITMFALLFSSVISSSPYLVQPAFAQGVVSPSSVSVELKKGESTSINKTITTGEVLGTPDVYFLFDATNSMFGSYFEVQGKILDIQNDILAYDSNAQFGLGIYEDFNSPGDAAFTHFQSITDDTNAVKTAFDSVLSYMGGGGDTPEAQFYALDTISKNSTIVDWRDDSSRIIVWIGDSPGHDPICSSVDPLVTSDITVASTITSLQSANIKVVAISLPYPWGGSDGLNHDSSIDNTDYPSCVQNGTSGQATSIVTGTDGILKPTNPGDIQGNILDAMTELSGDVFPDATDCTNKGLEVSYIPPSFTNVNSTTQVSFDETIKIPSGATDVQYTCDVLFKSGSDDGTIGTQRIIVNGGTSMADYPLEAPTIGRDELNSRQIVEDGFCIDGDCLTVTKYWHEEFGWELNSGNHTISTKIYCVEGVNSCSHVGLSGTPIGAFNVNNALWTTVIDNNFGRSDWNLVVTDPEDYIGTVDYTIETLDNRYLLVSFTIDFKTPTEGNLALGVHLWDYNRSLRNFWFNDGIDVLDAFSYPIASTTYENNLNAPKVCKAESNPDARNTCTFANKILTEITKAEEVLHGIPDFKSFAMNLEVESTNNLFEKTWNEMKYCYENYDSSNRNSCAFADKVLEEITKAEIKIQEMEYYIPSINFE